MKSKKDQEALFQLKLDYLSFITQIQDWHDKSITSIIFALLMEREKITQNQLMDLTGLSRSTISETLSLIINDPRGIPVLETRRKGDKKKYYYCPLTFEEYIKRLFGGTLKIIDVNLEFTPQLLYRLKVLKEQNEATLHVEAFMLFFYRYSQIIKVIMENFDETITNYFENPDNPKKFEELIQLNDLESIIKYRISESRILIKNDSLNLIKKDFLNEMLKLGQESSSGTNKELAYSFFLLYLNKDPITQEDIIKLTKSRRAAVSEGLSLIVRQNFAKVVKKENDRKKYYEPVQDVLSFISTRLKLSTHKINQIDLVMNSRFIPELNKLDINKAEKDVLLEFFQNTGHYYKIIGKWMTDMFDFILNNI